jgi:hypothetical protein
VSAYFFFLPLHPSLLLWQGILFSMSPFLKSTLV